ncbi:caspase domain-containing protein [Schizophyllum commune]
MSDYESDESYESTSSASSFSSSLSTTPSLRGFDLHQSISTIRRTRDALLRPVQVSLAMSWATFEPSLCTGRKKAVCVGINYVGAPPGLYEDPGFDFGQLQGCIKDTRRVYNYLMNDEDFQEDDILLLTDEDTTLDHLKPTKANILAAMQWLVEGAQQHDTLFFHCAGHGHQVEDMNGDETDCKDEAIVPWDYRDSGLITDDVIHSELVQKLPMGCRLTYRAHRFRRLHKKEHVEH